MRLTKISSIPPGSNPFHHDLSRMGVSLGSDLMAMKMNHDNEPVKDLVLVDTATGERFAVDTSKQEPVRIKYRSPSQTKDGLFDLKFMEGGGYISDWLHSLPQWSTSAADVPAKVAHMILEEIGLEPSSFGNKDFVCFTKDDEVTGHNDRPIKCFLYKHDWSWRIYTLNH